MKNLMTFWGLIGLFFVSTNVFAGSAGSVFFALAGQQNCIATLSATASATWVTEGPSASVALSTSPLSLVPGSTIEPTQIGQVVTSANCPATMTVSSANWALKSAGHTITIPYQLAFQGQQSNNSATISSNIGNTILDQNPGSFGGQYGDTYTITFSATGSIPGGMGASIYSDIVTISYATN